jgi:hypothetical protein
MNVFFDVDDTIISGWHGCLRPLVREVFHQLTLDHHEIYIWSGVGLRWAEIEAHQLRRYVRGCYVKPLRDHARALPGLGVKVKPEFVVDDNDEVVRAFGGYKVRPYVWPDETDREMSVVYDTIREITVRVMPQFRIRLSAHGCLT